MKSIHMKTRGWISPAFFAIAVLGLIVFSETAHGLTMLTTIDSPSECPAGLSVNSKVANGMIDFDITVDADAIANNPSYLGRARGAAYLALATAAGEPLAHVPLQGTTAGKGVRYQFRLASSAAKTAEVQVSVNLFEKDGMATIGGGVSMRIPLAKFAPTAAAPVGAAP